MICDECKMKGGKIKASTVKKLLQNSYSDNQAHEIDGFIRDDELSGNRAQVYYNPATGEAHVIHRGTQGIVDWKNNIAYGLNNYESTDRYKHAKKIQDEAEKKYGSENINTIGHSQGAMVANKLGKNTKNIISVDRPVNLRDLLTKTSGHTTDVRTKNDLVSYLMPYQMKGNKSNLITIPSETRDPLFEHSTDRLNKLGDQLIGHGMKENYIVQSVIFNKDKFTDKAARKWLKTHKYIWNQKLDERKNVLRYRQINPQYIEKKGYTNYHNKYISDHIILCIAYKK
jgi:hypothetical protein